MKRLFDPHSPFWYPFGVLGRLITLSLILLSGSLTVAGFGPVLAAALPLAKDYLKGDLGAFWVRFKNLALTRFKQSWWLGILYLSALWLILDLWPLFLLAQFEGTALAVSYGIVCLVACVLNAWFPWTLILLGQCSEITTGDAVRGAFYMLYNCPVRSLVLGFCVTLGGQWLITSWYWFWPLLLLPGLLIGLLSFGMQNRAQALRVER